MAGYDLTERAMFRKALIVNILIFVLAALAVVGFATWRYGLTQTAASIAPGLATALGADGGASSANSASGVTLIDFWAPWCGPCQTQGKILEQVEPKIAGLAAFQKVNVDEDRALAQQYGIRGIPTLVILKHGKEVERFVGVRDAETLIAAVKKHSL